jgi:hypothetical protein
MSEILLLANTAPAGGTVSAFYGSELWSAATLVVGAAAVTASALLWRRVKSTAPGGLITGADNRISTSKTIAAAWTLVVAWMVVAEAFVAVFPAHPPATFSGLLASVSDLYFVFLGGPFAAAVFAKASTQSKIAQGTLTKPPGTPSASDLISDDNGNVDLYDFQYVLFNILALLVVSISFAVHPDKGLPDIPTFLAILTGGSALTYAVNKATAADVPQITSVTPPNARIGDIITITGIQLFSTTAGGTLPVVTIGGISATGVAIPPGAADTVTATVTDAPSGTTALAGTVDVVVSPPLASPITARDAITIVPDQPAITGVNPRTVTAGALVTVTGTLLLTPGTSPGTVGPNKVDVGGVTPDLSVSGTPWPVNVEGPYSDSYLTIRIGSRPAGLGNAGATGNATLTLTRTGQPLSTTVKYSLT